MKTWLRENPWIWFALSFVAVVVASVAFVVIAEKNKPAEVPLHVEEVNR